MKERPILFSAPMILALRGNRKTVTRRTRGLDHVNSEPDNWIVEPSAEGWNFIAVDGPASGVIRCPYGVPGDRLYTRESYRALADYDFRKPRELTGDWIEVWYEADSDAPAGIGKLRPGIFMPRWASRDTLEVVSVRPERLQSITEEDAKAEGVEVSRCGQAGYAMEPIYSYRTGFVRVWCDINGPDSWAKNPWVWRVEFRRVSATQELGESA